MASGGARFLTDNTTNDDDAATSSPPLASTNVLDNSTNPDTKCFDVDALFGAPIGDNFSFDEKKAYKCSTALIWAKQKGIFDRPDFYKNYTGELFPNSSYANFQCVLYQMRGTDEAGSGQNCTYPCTSTLPECPAMGAGINTPGNATVETPAGGSSGSSGSWPVWGWILLALGIVGVIGGIAAMMMMGGKKTEKPKKKKRAVNPPAATPAPEPTPAAAPVAPVMTAPPVYVRSIQAAPTMMTAPPVYAAAPVTYAAPQAVPMATPIQTYAAPMQMATPVVTSAFDRLDTNHDGVITRAEFQQFGMR